MQISHSLENLIDALTRPTDAWVVEKLDLGHLTGNYIQ